MKVFIWQQFATKTDLHQFAIKVDMEKMRTEFRTRLHQVEKKLISKSHKSERRLMLMVGGSVVTICTFIVGALKYLPSLLG